MLESYVYLAEYGQSAVFNRAQYGTEALSSLIRDKEMPWQERLEMYIFLYQAVIPPDQMLPLGTSAYHFFASQGMMRELMVCIK